MKTKIQFLAIGDTVVDAFIKLKDAEIIENKTNETKKICMNFGDKVPFEYSVELLAVGNSANAAVSANRLGLSTALISHLGNDEYGIKSKKRLENEGINTDFVVLEENKKTNYHYVLWYRDERTILINHEHYNYKLSEKFLNNEIEVEYIYLSSLGENTLDFHIELANYLKNNTNTRLIFQPGTYQMKFGKDKLKDLYQISYLFFCNKEEAIRILETNNHDLFFLLNEFKKLGVKIPIITDGPNGSYALDENDELLHIPIYPDRIPPVERTGAGDAFASTCSVALIKGKSIKEAMIWGSINSMSVCEHVGAQEGLMYENDLIKLL